MTRIKLVLAGFIVSLLALAGVAVGGTPALAAFGGACSANAFCLYQWENLEGPTAGHRWQSSYQNFVNHSGGCINLTGATWDNGDPVSDNSGSAMFTTGANGGYWAGYAITVYNWVNCNAAGQYRLLSYASDNTSGAWNGLNQLKYDYPPGTTMNLYHTITSIRFDCIAAGC